MKFRKLFPLVIFFMIVVLIIFFIIRAILRPEFFIIIKNGSVIDGLGNKPFRADVGIRRGKIKEIGILAGRKSSKIIDAAGLSICPGFIDLHTHADTNILNHPNGHNYLRQGVTTVLGGNCGGSRYPIGPFLKKIKKKKIALNFCTLVGHNTVRRLVMGNANRKPDEKELEKMLEMVEVAMQEGAVGLSTGLKYMPGAYAETGEIIELAKVVQEYGGFYATHMREEGIGILDSLREAIEIGKAANIPVQISHHKITSVEKWGSSVQTLALVDAARDAGVDVILDQYPYPATSTGLTVLFPPWSLEGTPKECLKRWKDDRVKPRLAAEIKYNIEHDRGGNDLGRIMIARYTPEPELEGLSIRQILEKKNIPVTMEAGVEIIIQLQTQAIVEEGDVGVIYFCLSDEDIENIMKYPHTAHASDGGIRTFAVGKPHPRNYGAFPRVFKTYVREKGILSFEEAVRKMTSLPACRLGLKDRGIIKAGYYADITLVDPQQVADTATWQDPHRYPEGIPYVFVNGKIVVKKGKLTGKFPGKVLYGKGKGKAVDLEEITELE
ncbi:MAG: D-aminoacylase [Candidatus Aminicenantes bacterium]|nr:D-aminoacylase [Candidatus Aminicenantes bacterium]